MTIFAEPQAGRPRPTRRQRPCSGHDSARGCGSWSPQRLPAAAPANPPRPRLLVVDDEPAMGELLQLYFGAKGLEVIVARNVEQGSAVIREHTYDLAIVDWRLDGVPHGLDLLELSQATHPQAPVIIFTGVDDTRMLERQLAGRAAAVLRKMASLNDLTDTVAKLLMAAAKPRLAEPCWRSS